MNRSFGQPLSRFSRKTENTTPITKKELLPLQRRLLFFLEVVLVGTPSLYLVKLTL